MLREEVGHVAADHDVAAWMAELYISHMLQLNIPQQVRGLHELVIFAKCLVVNFPLLTWETVLRRTQRGHPL